ncbi:MAG: type I-U CRISPR-associated RAMP protein Csb1/Cas7u [Verrucomicrobiales bacterium]|nr:type I-U CRISPR-associated RAMP protein Csb1/Cas7u [Verrucomicrobiales bacterium]
MSDQEDPKKKEEQLKQDIELLDKLLGVEARKPGKAASLPAAIRIVETLEPAGGKQVPVFPASYAGATDQSPPVYDLAGVEYGEGEDTVRIKNGTAKIPRIIRAKMCALDSPQSQANRMEPAFLECDNFKQLVPQASASIPRRGDTEAASSVLTLPHRVADFRVRLSDKKDEVSTAITAFSKGDCLPLLRSFPTSLIFGFWNSRGEEEQGVKHARVLLARIDATDVVPCRRHSLYSGPYSKDEFAEAVLQRPISDEEAKKLSKEGFSAAPSDGLGGVIVNGTIERLSLLSLTDIARLHCKAPEKKNSDDADKSGTKQPTAAELTNAARRYVFALAALAEGHERSKGSHRLRSGCELVAAEKLENGKLQKIEDRFEFRGAKPTDGDALKQLYFCRERLIAIAQSSMAFLGIKADAVSYNVTAATLTREIVSADQAAKERAKAEKEAKDATDKAAKANQDAEGAEKKAAESGTAADKKKADKARKKANALQAKADELAKKLEAPSPADTPAVHPDGSTQAKTDEPTESAPAT